VETPAVTEQAANIALSALLFAGIIAAAFLLLWIFT
jgi:hypothetical protein